jgi:hypothetical protein
LIWTLGEGEEESVMTLDSYSDRRIGAIMFRDKGTGESFSAILGMHDGWCWSDIAIAYENATAHTIHNNYNNYNYRNGKFWKVKLKGYDWVKTPLAATGEGLEKSIVMTVREVYTEYVELTSNMIITVR